MAEPAPRIELDRAALLIAAHAYPGLGIDEQRRRLDALAAPCSDRSPPGITRYLFGEVGFRGDDDNYYDPRNSFLNEVLDRRVGIPITLSVLLIEVGRRAGVAMYGVGMPGHFLVGAAGDTFVDPFHGGQLLDRAGCRALYHERQGHDAPWSDTFLDPVDSHQIVTRMLANLQSIYFSTDLRSAAWVVRLRLLVPTASDRERQGLAQALLSLGQFGDAATELDRLGLTDDARRARARTN
jgi:regulator of sirC expression with transglutaminase-like and TPR domain